MPAANKHLREHSVGYRPQARPVVATQGGRAKRCHVFILQCGAAAGRARAAKEGIGLVHQQVRFGLLHVISHLDDRLAHVRIQQHVGVLVP